MAPNYLGPAVSARGQHWPQVGLVGQLENSRSVPGSPVQAAGGDRAREHPQAQRP